MLNQQLPEYDSYAIVMLDGDGCLAGAVLRVMRNVTLAHKSGLARLGHGTA